MTPSTTFRRRARVLTLATAVLCAAPLASAGDGPHVSGNVSRKTLVVRIYNLVGVSRRDLAEADRVAGSILGMSGVDVQWKLCTMGLRAPEASTCRQTLASDEVIMRLSNAPEPMTPGVTSLGFAAIDTHGRQSVLSTVYVDRVHITAARAKVGEARLAGRAMAHELGHLLIGTHGHATRGLMRANWTDASLQSESGEDWTLSPSEVAAIRERPAPAPVVSIAGGN